MEDCMDDYLGMRSTSAPNNEYTDAKPGEMGTNGALLTDAARTADAAQPMSDLGSSILQSLLYWERIFAYQEGGRPRRTNGDTECAVDAKSGTEGEPISA